MKWEEAANRSPESKNSVRSTDLILQSASIHIEITQPKRNKNKLQGKGGLVARILRDPERFSRVFTV